MYEKLIINNFHIVYFNKNIIRSQNVNTKKKKIRKETNLD